VAGFSSSRTVSELVNVCTGTVEQKALRDYLERPAINGRESLEKRDSIDGILTIHG
jgi:hypothetical protein